MGHRTETVFVLMDCCHGETDTSEVDSIAPVHVIYVCGLLLGWLIDQTCFCWQKLAFACLTIHSPFISL